MSYNKAKVRATAMAVGAVLDAAELTDIEAGVIVASIISSGAEYQTSHDPLTYIDGVTTLSKLDFVGA